MFRASLDFNYFDHPQPKRNPVLETEEKAKD